MLSKKQLLNICMLGSGSKTCRYLGTDDDDPSKYVCLKLASDKKRIDSKIVDKTAKTGGVLPTHMANWPMGNNCEGYPLLKHIEQGYDKP